MGTWKGLFISFSFRLLKLRWPLVEALCFSVGIEAVSKVQKNLFDDL